MSNCEIQPLMHYCCHVAGVTNRGTIRWVETQIQNLAEDRIWTRVCLVRAMLAPTRSAKDGALWSCIFMSLFSLKYSSIWMVAFLIQIKYCFLRKLNNICRHFQLFGSEYTSFKFVFTWKGRSPSTGKLAYKTTLSYALMSGSVESM